MKRKNLATICALSLTIPMAFYAPVVNAAPDLVPGIGDEMQPPGVEQPPVQVPERENPSEERPEQPENPEPPGGNPDNPEPTPAPEPEPKPEPRPEPKPEPEPEQPGEKQPNKPSPSPEPKPEPKPETKPDDTPREKQPVSPNRPEQSAKDQQGPTLSEGETDGIIIADAGGASGSNEDQGDQKSDGDTAGQEGVKESADSTPQTEEDKMVKTAVGADQVSLLISLIGATLTLGVLLLRFGPAVFRRDVA